MKGCGHKDSPNSTPARLISYVRRAWFLDLRTRRALDSFLCTSPSPLCPSPSPFLQPIHSFEFNHYYIQIRGLLTFTISHPFSSQNLKSGTIMLLRFRGPDGMVRITVERADTFARLGEKVCFHWSSKKMFLYWQYAAIRSAAHHRRFQHPHSVKSASRRRN
jgi:hypothetical protein